MKNSDVLCDDKLRSLEEEASQITVQTSLLKISEPHLDQFQSKIPHVHQIEKPSASKKRVFRDITNFEQQV